MGLISPVTGQRTDTPTRGLLTGRLDISLTGHLVYDDSTSSCLFLYF